METPGNKACLAQMARLTLDPARPEDSLKVDADSAGRGGDDMADETRYGLMARPLLSLAPPAQDEENKSMGYDYEKKQQRKRETGEEALAKLIGSPESATVGRFRVPIRRGT
jgi:hypothetical protein